MCIRYALHRGDLFNWIDRIERRADRKLIRHFDRMVEPEESFPGESGTIVRLTEGDLELLEAQWGLTPAWATGAKYANFGRKNAYNARAETVYEKPTFRDAIRRHRCLVPASEFFERADGRWLRLVPKDGPFGIAGLYEPGNEASGGRTTFTMVTTTPNEAIVDVHDRMPVVLEERDYNDWLDPDRDPLSLRGLLVPCPPDWFTIEDAGPVHRRKSDETPALFED